MMGLLSSPQVLRESVDSYYDEKNVQDLAVYSPYGFCNEDYNKLSQAEGIASVFASKDIDCHGLNSENEVSTFRV